ncbi:MAG: hypothetical protein FJ368_02925 [Pelagibacterales bacterium]|nr:hypothetical protein [Pelagibacterales bacterium]
MENLKNSIKNRFGLKRLPTDQEIHLLLQKMNGDENFYLLIEEAEKVFIDCWTGNILEQKSITDDLIVEIQTLKKRLGL